MPEIGSLRIHTIPPVSQSHRAFPELALRLGHFTARTRAKLARSLVQALRGRRPASSSGLNEAVVEGCRELRATGLSDPDIMTFFGALVEEAGLACGADRPSLIPESCGGSRFGLASSSSWVMLWSRPRPSRFS